MSAIAPAGSASSITGRVSAASTSATIDGDDESEVINQPAPTSCIQVPMFETIVAIHTLRNSPLRSGLHGDCVLRYGSLRSEEHTSELQSRLHLVCRLLLEKQNSPVSLP